MANISVFVRIRPMLPSEINAHQQEERRFNVSNSMQQIQVDLSERREKVFQFNKVFLPETTQEQLFNGLDLPSLVNKVLEGYHSTVFAYGQTGSGKTYTIEGPNDDPGLVPRVFEHLFGQMSRRNNTERVYKVILSFVQIYNEGIYDLIDVNGKPLKMRWNKHQQFIVQNLFEVQCRNKEDAVKWWSKGQKNKVMGAHKMNMASSRSHCLLTLKVISYDIEDPSDTIESKFQIVDLAGSQRQKVTKSTGVVFKEGIEINKSLFTLRQVIASLYDISQGENPNKHIPYRDSKLTSLLKQSIGGNTFCSMIACLNPSSVHFEESVQTLTYASMASFINNAPSKNVDPKIRENEQLRQQNEQYRKQIKKMAEHIEQLTKMLEAGTCASCKNGPGPLLERNRLQTESPRTKQYEQSEPLGILKLPKFNSRSGLTEQVTNSVPEATTNKTTNATKVQKKTLKTTKDILESITMIKELINANSGLREKIQILKDSQAKQQKQIYALNKENQVLRDRYDMMSDTLGARYAEPNYNEAPIAQYERLLQEEKGVASQMSRPARMYSQNSRDSQINKQTYNQFLKKSLKQEQIKGRKRGVTGRQNSIRRSQRSGSFLQD